MPVSRDEAKGVARLLSDKEPILREKLLACSFFRDRDNRLLIIKHLDWSIADHPDEQTHTTNIIDACSDHDRGLQKLIFALRSYERDRKGKETRPMRELDQCMSQLFPGRTTYEQFDALAKIVKEGNWSYEILENVYRASVQRSPLSRSGSLLSLLEELADEVQQEDGHVPLLTFVDKLAYLTDDPQVRESLQTWRRRVIDEQAIKFPREMQGVKPSGSLPLRELQSNLGFWDQHQSVLDEQSHLLVSEPHNEAYTDAFPFIQIAFVPNASGGNRAGTYTIQTWYWEDADKKSISLGKKDDVLLNAPVLPAEIHEILNEISARWYHQTQPIIELFLPDELLHTNISQRRMTIDGGTLCSIYPVVIRSLDRVREQDHIVMNNWKRYWDRLKEIKNIQLTIFHKEEYHKLKADFQNILLGALEHGEFPIFAFVPAPNLAEKPPLEAVRKTGTPIAFWLCSLPDRFNPITFAKACKKLLANRDFATLPHFLWEQRTAALSRRNTSHFIHYLTLLWDDPYRVPVDLNSSIFPQISINETKTTEDPTTGK